jgi:hypothetical protein
MLSSGYQALPDVKTIEGSNDVKGARGVRNPLTSARVAQRDSRIGCLYHLWKESLALFAELSKFWMPVEQDVEQMELQKRLQDEMARQPFSQSGAAPICQILAQGQRVLNQLVDVVRAQQ